MTKARPGFGWQDSSPHFLREELRPQVAVRRVMKRVLALLLLVGTIPFANPLAEEVQLPARLQDDTSQAEIREFVRQMDLDALVGQSLMIGYWVQADTQASNDGLADLIREYRPGGVILFKHNFEITRVDSRDGSVTWLSDLDVARGVAELTKTLQIAARDSYPALPLLIALDQEGGGGSHLKKGVTRIPYAIQFGASRNARLAYDAGRVVGDELTDLGINTVLAPVADVNNNNENDIIGRRAYGAHPDIVSPLASAFAKGLQIEGALSIAKHFPGHGSSQDDPHYVLPVMGYDDKAQFEESDLAPFRTLIEEGIDGILTAHILVRFLDANAPVTFSKHAVEDLLRSELKFEGLVLSDDLSAMRGPLKDPQDPQGPNRWRHAEIVSRAYDAGNDMLIFGYIQNRESGSVQARESTVTRSEFEEIFQAARRYFADPSLDSAQRTARRKRLEESVERILVAKVRTFGNWDRVIKPAKWLQPFDETSYREKLEGHQKVSEAIARSSAVLISEEGRTINNLADSKYFNEGKGPLTQDLVLKSSADTVSIVSPVFRDDELSEEIGSRWIHPSRLNTTHMVYGYYNDEALAEASRIWEQDVRRLSTLNDNGELAFDEDAINEKALEIIEASRDSRVIVFGVLTDGQIRVLEQVCKHFREDDGVLIVVLLFREPYFVPQSLYRQTNTAFLFVPALPTMKVAADLLFGELQPHPVSHLPVSVPGMVNRNIAPGAKVVPLVPEPHPEPDIFERLLQWFATLGAWSFLAGALGGLCFWLVPRGHLRWSEKARSQWNWVDLALCLAAGLVIAWLLGTFLPFIGVLEFQGVKIPEPGALPISALAFLITIIVEWFWLSKIRQPSPASPVGAD